MSPEQATGARVDARSDIFSFGAMLYQMVTGVRAFAGTSAADTLGAVMRAQPKPPTAVVGGVPADLERVILRCLRKDPERRFQHMGDVRVELQELEGDIRLRATRGRGCQSPPERWHATPRDDGRYRRRDPGCRGCGALAPRGNPPFLSTVTAAPALVQLTSERPAWAAGVSPHGTQIRVLLGG